MSFGGHVNDMVNRVKQNAALKNARKHKFKGGNDYSTVKSSKTAYDFPEVSPDNLKDIKESIKTSTKFERNKRLIYAVLISIVALVSLLLLNV